MTELYRIFPTVVLSGYSSASFDVLFLTAQKFLDSNAGCNVKYEFNGYLIEVNNNTINTAWDKYLKKEFNPV